VINVLSVLKEQGTNIARSVLYAQTKRTKNYLSVTGVEVTSASSNHRQNEHQQCFELAGIWWVQWQ
jgi:hypothetical protein